MNRAWINAPSTLQSAHEYHGQRVLVDLHNVYTDNISKQRMATVWFVEGNRESALIELRYLLFGWPDKKGN